MARGELHVQLSVNYADDEKLAFVSRTARLLYVDALCLSKRLLNDGVLTVLQVERLMYPERPKAARKAADELVQSGAWTWRSDEQVFVISAWLKRNKSREQIEKDREAREESSLLGNHRRWHEARGEHDPGCKFCSGTRSTTRSSPDREGESTETETETETEKNNTSSSPATPATDNDTPAETKSRRSRPSIIGTDNDPEFVRFWAAYPRKVGKGQARKAWAKAIKANANPEDIIAGAERYARERKGEDSTFTAHPATWLHGERWDDTPHHANRVASGAPSPWWEN